MSSQYTTHTSPLAFRNTALAFARFEWRVAAMASGVIYARNWARCCRLVPTQCRLSEHRSSNGCSRRKPPFAAQIADLAPYWRS